MIERGRFAPTPSGALHIGSARTAVASALAAWSAGGRWCLRVEDLDVTRTVRGAVEAMLEDLRWLGLQWDEGPGAEEPHAPYRQSERGELYREALSMLRRAGRVYPCACSRREVEGASTAPHGAEPVYPGTCAARDPDEVIAAARSKARQVSWRFRVDRHRSVVTVRDEVVGDFTQDVARDVGDFVVFRADGVAAYQLAVVVDDIAQEVTEVVRGDDLLASAPRQSLLYDALGARAPRWAHVPLVLGVDGERLAKRHGAMGVRELRARGHDAKTVTRAILSTLGVEEPGEVSLRAIAARWDLSKIPRSSPRWSVAHERFEAS